MEDLMLADTELNREESDSDNADRNDSVVDNTFLNEQIDDVDEDNLNEDEDDNLDAD